MNSKIQHQKLVKGDKMKKKIMMFLIMFVSMMFFNASVLANATSGSETTTNTLTLKFVDTSGNYVSGVQYNINDRMDNDKCSASDSSIIVSGTSTNSASTHNLVNPPFNYVCVSIQSVPTGYLEPSSQWGSFSTDKTLVFTLQQEGKIGIGFKNSSGNLISGVKYSFYSNSNCTGTAIATGTSLTSYKSHTFDAPGTYYIKTTSVPSGYNSLSCTAVLVYATSRNVDWPLSSTSDDDSATTPTESEEIGKIGVGFKNSSGSLISGVKYSFYSNSNCTGTAIATGTSLTSYKSHTFDAPGTYYIKTTSVPSGYNSLSCTAVLVYATSRNVDWPLSSTSDNNSTTTPTGSEEKGKIAIGFVNSSDFLNLISGVKYSLYDNVNCSGTAIDTGTSSTSYKSHLFDAPDTYYIKTTYVPSGYNSVKCEPIAVGVTSKDYGVILQSITETPEVEQGTIKINVVDKETGKALSNVGVQVCKTETCDGNDEKYAFTTASKELKVEYGTYYIVVSSVPNGYEKPETIKITVDKENPISTTKLEVLKQTEVPNTLSNVSKTFIICGLIGMIAGISLLYFNAKKQEEI